jgi:hypothetical protein
LIDRRAALKTWVNADERLGPESIAGIDRFYLCSDIWCAEVGERAGKPLIIPDERLIEFEDIHVGTRRAEAVS